MIPSFGRGNMTIDMTRNNTSDERELPLSFFQPFFTFYRIGSSSQRTNRFEVLIGTSAWLAELEPLPREFPYDQMTFYLVDPYRSHISITFCKFAPTTSSTLRPPRRPWNAGIEHTTSFSANSSSSSMSIS